MGKLIRTVIALIVGLSVPSAAGMVTVKSGWNLVGTGCGLDVSSFEDPSNIEKVTTVWQWDESNMKWLVWSPDKDIMTLLEKFGLETFNNIAPYKGFWINAKDTFYLDLCDYDCHVETSPTMNLPEGLIAHYTFDTVNYINIKDESGNENNGYVEGEGIDYVEGISGKAIRVKKGIIHLPIDLVKNGTFTVNMWIFPGYNDFWPIAILDNNTDIVLGLYMDAYGQYDTYFSVYFDDTYHSFSSGIRGEGAKSYHMLTMVRDPNFGIAVYIDGELRGGTKLGNIENATELIVKSGGPYYDSVFDEMAFWNRRLSDTEIKALYDKYVNQPPKIETTTFAMSAGQEISIPITDPDENDEIIATIKSSNEDVVNASYDNNGFVIIRANSEGDAIVTITATDTKGAKTTVEYKVIVK